MSSSRPFPLSEIVDTHEKSIYWRHMLSLWGLAKHINHFPGAHPVSIERSHLRTLCTEEFLCGLKTDGVRHVLMMTLKPGTRLPISILVDRAKNMYEIEIWGHEDFFTQGTLLDGELVWNRHNHHQLLYVVFDAILIRGVKCTDFAYDKRMHHLRNDVLITAPSADNLEQIILEEMKFVCNSANVDFDLCVVPKRCVPMRQLRELWKQGELENHHNDGLIFTKNSCGMDTGTSRFTFKWKYSHTVDVHITREHGAYVVRVNANTDSRLIDITSIAPERSFEVVDNDKLRSLKLPCIVECVVRIEGERVLLTPERQRTDKSSANNARTVLATTKNVEENITIDDLLDAVAPLERSG